MSLRVTGVTVLYHSLETYFGEVFWGLSPRVETISPKLVFTRVQKNLPLHPLHIGCLPCNHGAQDRGSGKLGGEGGSGGGELLCYKKHFDALVLVLGTSPVLFILVPLRLCFVVSF